MPTANPKFTTEIGSDFKIERHEDYTVIGPMRFYREETDYKADKETEKEKSELRKEILKFILLVFGIFVLICSVRAESGIALALSIMTIINVAMKY